MRLATSIALIVLSVASVAPVPQAAAQPGSGVQAYGLGYAPLGAATLGYDPVARRLPVNNLGSSGQDGVEVQLGRQSRGYVFSWDSTPDLGAGGSHTVTMRGNSGGIGALVTCSMTVHQNADGSCDLSPNFAQLGATSCWVVLRSVSRVVLKRYYQKLPVTLHVTAGGTGLPAPEAKVGVGMGKSMYEWIRCTYDGPVHVSGVAGDPVGIDCADVLFGCDAPTHMDELNAVDLTGASPAPPASFTLSGAAIVPPCAGCPNGPTDDDAVVAMGDAVWSLAGTPGAPLGLDNLGATIKDGPCSPPCLRGGCPPCLRESPSLPSLGATGMVIDESPIAPGTLDIRVIGTFSDGTYRPGGELRCAIDNSEAVFQPDFSAVGSQGYRVVLYSGGAVVGDITNPAAYPSHQKPAQQWLVQADQAGGTGPMEFRIICITSPCPGWTVTVNGVVYIADQIVFQPVGSAVESPLGVASLEMAGAPQPGTPSASRPGTNATRSLLLYGVSESSGDAALGVGDPTPLVAATYARVSPNPAPGPMRLAFALPHAGMTSVAVLDAAGRQVRSLAFARFAAGAHELAWDGRDGAGHASAPGIYFVRIAGTDFTRTARVTRLE